MNELPPPPIVMPAHAHQVAWHRLPSLSVGTAVAGAYVGVLQDRLLIAGGASFPDGKTRVFVDRIHAMVRRSDGTFVWEDVRAALPYVAGYGAAIPWSDSLLLIGGRDDVVCHSDVVGLRLEPYAIEHWPRLPIPLAHFAAARVGTVVVVAGGQSSLLGPALDCALLLDLAAEQPHWEELPRWPGPPRTAAIGVALGDHFYLIGGRETRPGQPTRPMSDAYELDIVKRTWRKLPDVGVPAEPPAMVMAATAVPLERDRFLVLGGGAADYLIKRERLERDLAAAQSANDSDRAAHLSGRLESLPHPGFQRAMRIYDRSTNRWSRVDDMPFAQPPVTTTAVVWNTFVVLPSGETRPRTRTVEIWAAPIGDFLHR